MENVCRFCLDTTHDNFEVVKDFTKEVIDVLLLKIDFNLSLVPIICGICSKKLKNFFDFKCTCLYTEDAIAPFAESQKNSYVNLHDVYIEQKVNERSVNIPSDQKICRLCMKFVFDTYISLDMPEKDVILLRDIIKQYFPEVNLAVTEDPIVCNACYRSLKKFSYFINTCLQVEEIIEKYRKSNIADVYIKLSSILQFRLKEEQNKKIITEEDVRNGIKSEDIIDKKSKDSVRKMSDTNIETGKVLLPEDYKKSIKKRGRRKNATKEKNIIVNPPLTLKTPPQQATPMCSHCLDGDNKFITLQIDNHTDVKIQGCDCCVPEAKTGGLRRAVAEYATINRKTYGCRSCAFRTKIRLKFVGHILSHVYRRRNKIFKCGICEEEATFITNYTKHLKLHKIDRFECGVCDFVTTREQLLRGHIRWHINRTDTDGAEDRKLMSVRNRLVSGQTDPRIENIIYTLLASILTLLWIPVIIYETDSHVQEEGEENCESQ